MDHLKHSYQLMLQPLVKMLLLILQHNRPDLLKTLLITALGPYNSKTVQWTVNPNHMGSLSGFSFFKHRHDTHFLASLSLGRVQSHLKFLNIVSEFYQNIQMFHSPFSWSDGCLGSINYHIKHIKIKYSNYQLAYAGTASKSDSWIYIRACP